MRRLVRFFCIAVCALPALVQAAPCGDEDFRTWVSAGNECVLVAVANGSAERTAGPSPTLIVWLHGDTSGGGPAMSHVRPAQEAAQRHLQDQVMSVAMWRPGYGDAEGRASSGDNHGRSDHYTEENMAIVGDAIERLKAHYRPARTIVVGHSGGAATAANLLGMRPGLIDAAVLIACPCDLRVWRAGRRWWPRSEDPAKWVDRVQPPVRVIALTGLADDNTRPELAEGYVGKLAARHVEASFIGISGATHNSALLAPEVAASIDGLLR